MLQLHSIQPNPGAKHRKKRLGNGKAPVLARLAAKATRARRPVPAAPSARDLKAARCPFTAVCPRRFNNTRFQDKILIVNLSQLERVFEAGATVDENSLRAAKLVQGPCDAVKLLGNGTLTKSLNVIVDFVSASAREKRSVQAGGSVTVLSEA